MKRRIVIVAFIMAININLGIAQEKLLSLIPYPQKVTLVDNDFNITKSVKILIDKSDKEMLRLAEVLNRSLAQNLKITSKARVSKVIEIAIDKSLAKSSEAYQLIVNRKNVKITAANYAGVFYGIQTLHQLVEGDLIKGVMIEDEPRFKYRGLHIDVCRHFFPVEFIKKFIDVMAFYKYNNLHWHLTEDQGWRIEIKKYPKLTEIGSKRAQTKIGHYGDKLHEFDGVPVEGFYTQEQIKEIVAYAKGKYINVIPEIEMPGHATAALTSYPHLGCKGEDYKVAENWGVFHTIYCAGKESTFKFLEDVIDEVVELFPSKYIHIGGDEAFKDHWKECLLCKKRMEEEGLKDFHELQSYFIQRMEKYINSKGKQIIGWDEILEGGLAPNATVMSWRGMKGGIAAANMDHDVIMTPGSPCYFDNYQGPKSDEPLAIGGMNTLEKVYEFNPFPKELPTEKHHFILGAQANLWSEYIKTEDHMEYMAYPRACALSEVLWSSEKKSSFEEFKNRMKKHYEFLDAMNVNYFDKEK